MQPHNFLREAIKGVGDFIEDCEKHKIPISEKYCVSSMQLLHECQKAVKFVLPEGGKIFDTGFAGLSEKHRLPFNQVLIEYLCESFGSKVAEKVFGEENTMVARKRIVYAEQDGDKILVYSVLAFQRQYSSSVVWCVQPFCAELIPANLVEGQEISVPQALSHMKTQDQFRTKFYDLGGQAQISFGNRWEEHAYVDMLDEVNAVLSMMEALSCKNVESEALPVKPNKFAQRKKGALPYDEYRVLVIKGRKESECESHGGSHRSPREHLRRGHIRRLHSGNIWVNATIVNPGNHGKVKKVYALEAA